MNYALTIGCVLIGCTVGIITIFNGIQTVRRDIFEARDAARWRMIDILRDRYGSVSIAADDNGVGIYNASICLRNGKEFTAATIDVALAQALNADWTKQP